MATNEVLSEATKSDATNEVLSDATKSDTTEVKNEVIVPPYSAPLSPTHHHNNIILLLMIKNEERIIQRCLSHALPHVDAVSILDTGSTDHTIERCRSFCLHAASPSKSASSHSRISATIAPFPSRKPNSYAMNCFGTQKRHTRWPSMPI